MTPVNEVKAVKGIEYLRIGGRRYRKFIRHPWPVTDGTVRCIACGQIDEPRYHCDADCPATTAGRAALQQSAGFQVSQSQPCRDD